ncbi:MAG TPA: ATP-binding protein [Bacteroidia bacterium]|nr:ATP-binding protein [Bacteroidia bacterium]
MSVVARAKSFLKSRYSFLLLAILCLLLGYLCSISRGTTAGPGLNGFVSTLHEKEKDLTAELDSLFATAQGKSYSQIFLSENVRTRDLYRDKGIVLLIYQGDTLKYWSDNSAAVENYMKEVCLDQRMSRLRNGWFETIQRTDNTGRVYLGLLLIKNEYPYENQYLINSFAEGFRMPPETKIVVGQPESTTSVNASDGTYLFSLVFKQQGSTDLSVLQLLLHILLTLLGGVFLIAFLRKESSSLRNSLGKRWPAVLFVAFIVLLRFLTILIHYPAPFYDLPLFSPLHYGDANSFWNPNLGDFLINVSLFFYLAVYVNAHLKKYPASIPAADPSSAGGKWKTIGLASLLLCIPAVVAWGINSMISGLVQNSDISFQVNNLFGLSEYSYTGIFMIALMLASFFLLSESILRILEASLKPRRNRLIALLIATAAVSGVHHLFGSVDLLAILWPMSVLFVLILRNSEEEGEAFSFSIIVFLVLLFSFYTTHMLLKQGMHKEHDSRIVFADKLAAEQDPFAEHFFSEIEEKLSTDTALIRTTQAPTPDFALFEKTIRQQYFSGYWEKYEVKVTLFDTMCTPLLRSSSPWSDNILHFEEMCEKEGAPTFSDNFFYIDKGTGRISYLAKVVLQYPGRETHLGQGTLFIEFDSKLMSEEIGFPELLLDRELGLNQKLINYSYAKYKNGQLLNRAGEYQYGLTTEFIPGSGQYNYIETDGWDHLVYRPDETTIVILSKVEEGWLGKATSFSYIFAYFSLLLIVSLFLRQLLVTGPTFSNLTFKYRIQLVLVMIVLVSLGLFGAGSIYYIRQQYQVKNAEIISEKAHSVVLEIEGKLQEDKLNASYRDYATYLLKKFSNVFFTDINLYDPEGNLYASSRPKVFDEGLASRKMNPEAFGQISVMKKSEYIHDENIGNLAYLSAYLPVKNKEGQLQAYLNIPYFAKQNDLEKEISTFMVALINVYVFLFALAVLAAIFISNYLTHPLRLIQEKMRQVKLGKKNDPIEWKSKDEIGSLVGEYNRMIVELSNSAELLAQSERESAWREMAKQVAHEIKNPLTPMRLSIQLLERAYKDKAPDIDQKVERLSRTVLEQIDTLSSIASAFSDFAKMPKPILETMELRTVVQNTLELFSENDEDVEFEFRDEVKGEMTISGDREQLPRVFNNLFRNAIQAIPEGRKGKVIVELSRQNKHFIVSVKDNGTGIADEVIDKIFVPNFTTKSTGMGLGLAMVKNIVEGCGGMIWFETTRDKGTTFYVSFDEVTE